MSPTDPHRARRLELVLGQLESLPTLPAIALRVLQVAGDDDSDARQVVQLISGDMALAGKVLAMCRTADRGVANVTTVERAVVLLGFEAVRGAVLSLKVLEVFEDAAAAPTGLDHRALWRHSLAVGILSELIAAEHRHAIGAYTPAEAFICGLLHDVGKLAMDHLLPKSYQRVIELTDQHQLNIADVERKVIGLDHNTVGKRLAEHWQLPHLIQDCIWLHGSPPHSVPALPHRSIINIVTIADLAVRQRQIGYSGNHQATSNLDQHCRDLGFEAPRVHAAVERLNDEFDRRADAMGLGPRTPEPSRKVFLDSVMQANTVLGRANQQLEHDRRVTAGQQQTLEAITEFHRVSSRPGRGMQDVLRAVVNSASAILGRGYHALLYQPAADQPWLLTQYGSSGTLISSDFVDPPDGTPRLSEFAPTSNVSMQMVSMLPWLGQSVARGVDVSRLCLLALPCGWGTAAVLLHPMSDAQLPPADQLQALLHTWGSAIAATAQHLGARRLGEQLVQTSRELVEAQDKLLRNQSMARLGEMAAGAAHEMNNPLAVISGRAQLLATKLPVGSREHADAQQIWQQAEKLSELITALRTFADPPRPQLAATTAQQVLERAVQILHQREPDAAAPRHSGIDAAPPLHTDLQQLAAALAELLVNAAQARPRTAVRVAASVDPVNDRFLLRVVDDGIGMDAATLMHAFDPFFSAKQAGRQAGLGLAKAKRIAEGLGGDIELVSHPGEGSTATLSVPLGSDAAQGEMQKIGTAVQGIET